MNGDEDSDSPQNYWGSLRFQAAAAVRTALSDGPSPSEDLLGAIAWRSGFPFPYDLELHDLIGRARFALFPWKLIAEAAGEGSDAAAVNRLQEKFAYWERTKVNVQE